MEARNLEYLFFGFLAAWLIPVIYLVTMIARERSLKREVENLRKLIEDRERNQ